MSVATLWRQTAAIVRKDLRRELRTREVTTTTVAFSVLLMVIFIAIWVWAWRPKHRRTFDSLAALPMEDGAAGEAAIEHVDEKVDGGRRERGAAK